MEKTLFEQQLLGWADRTPDFFAEYELLFGEPYTYTTR